MNTGTEQRMQSALKKVTNMSFQNFFSSIYKGLFCILTSELALEATLLSSTVLSLLKEDKQFQQSDYRAWQLHPTQLIPNPALMSALFLLSY